MPVTYCNNMSANQSSSILPTAQITLCNTTDKTMNIIALFDICSQKSFIRESNVNELNLTVLSTVKMCIEGFGNAGTEKPYDVVQVNVKTNEGMVQVYCMVVDRLPNQISMTGRSTVVKALKNRGVILADYTDSTAFYTDVGMLIGVDHYFSFLYAQRIQENVYILPTKVGNVIAVTVHIESNASVSLVTLLQIFTNSDNIYDETNANIEKIMGLWHSRNKW